MCEVEIGIDSFSFCYPLTSKQKSQIIEKLKLFSKFQTRCSDYFEKTYDYTSDYFAKRGVKLRIFKKKGSIWNLFITIHPSLLMGDNNRLSVKFPSKTILKVLLNNADSMLGYVHCPCKLRKMKLYRVDVTANLIFEDSDIVDSYLRILKKSLLLPRYHEDYFRKGERKAKDYKQANKHSYKQSCKAAAFFAYDKTAQLEMIDALPFSLIDKKVLRLEVQLRRKGMKKWVNKDHMDDCIKTLEILYTKTNDIICWYLKRIQLKNSNYVQYKEAAQQIAKLKNKKTRERMLYLLRKTSDRHTLSKALEDLRKEFRLNSNQVNRVLRKFSDLGISPITLTNADTMERLPALSNFLK